MARSQEFLLCELQLSFRLAIRGLCGTVEVQLLNMKRPGRRQSIERTVCMLKDVFGKVVTERVEDAFRSLGLIGIAFARIPGSFG